MSNDLSTLGRTGAPGLQPQAARGAQPTAGSDPGAADRFVERLDALRAAARTAQRPIERARTPAPLPASPSSTASATTRPPASPTPQTSSRPPDKAAASASAADGRANAASGRETASTRAVAQPRAASAEQEAAPDAGTVVKPRHAREASDSAAEPATKDDGDSAPAAASAGGASQAPGAAVSTSSPLAIALVPWLARAEPANGPGASHVGTGADDSVDCTADGTDATDIANGKGAKARARPDSVSGLALRSDGTGSLAALGPRAAAGAEAGARSLEAAARAPSEATRPASGERAMDFSAGLAAAAAARGTAATPSAPAAPGAHGVATLAPVTEPVGMPTFAPALSERVVLMLTAGLQHAQVEVNPPELGPVRIDLSLAAETASVAFSAALPETRYAIEQTLPVLRDLLAERGVQLADARIEAGFARADTAGSAFGQERSQGEQASRGSASGSARPGADAAPVAAPGAASQRAMSAGRLDLFA